MVLGLDGGLRRLDQAPAKVRRPLTGDRAEPDALAGVAYAGREPGEGGKLAGRGEAVDFANLGDHKQSDEVADAGDLLED